MPNVLDELTSTYPDAKFLLFESEPGRWLDNVYIKAQEAALNLEVVEQQAQAADARVH